jgi:crotonobetainyl-CoA:carnitine CoA-transferase CaiB-like acyl-CoA transferase
VKPLEDVRIIAIEQYGAGPFGSVHLADLGAEVIKIEDPAGGWLLRASSRGADAVIADLEDSQERTSSEGAMSVKRRMVMVYRGSGPSIPRAAS